MSTKVPSLGECTEDSLSTAPRATGFGTITAELMPSSITIAGVDVAIINWPSGAAVRGALAALRRPRLLLIEPGVQAPGTIDPMEDWLRAPAHPSDLLLRAQTLSRRALGDVEVVTLELDEFGVLHRGERWVAVAEKQLRMLRVLLDNLDRVVPLETIVAAYVTSGGSEHVTSVRTALNRLNHRVGPLGLELTSVRRRGVILRSAPF